MSYNKIQNDGMQEIMKYLAVSQCIQYLNLSNNLITLDGVLERTKEFLVKCISLKVLNLHNQLYSPDRYELTKQEFDDLLYHSVYFQI